MSILVLLSWGLGFWRWWRSVHSRCSRLPELLHFEILTLFPRAMRIWQPVVRCLSFALEEIFPVFDTGGEVARTPGVLTPRRPATNWSQ